MTLIQRFGCSAVVLALTGVTAAFAQAPAAAPGGAPPPMPPRLSVTSPAWPDGGEVPMRNAMRGDNKSPAFEFHWMIGAAPAAAPEALQSYAIVFHDIENATNKGTTDTLHWTVFNIPGTAKGLPEGLDGGDLPDGTRNGPGINARMGKPPSYFGPGPGPGAPHHYVFDFYALDTKLALPASTTREELLKAMDGHIISKAAYFGLARAPAR